MGEDSREEAQAVQRRRGETEETNSRGKVDGGTQQEGKGVEQGERSPLSSPDGRKSNTSPWRTARLQT